jgi:hypothetical protein
MRDAAEMLVISAILNHFAAGAYRNSRFRGNKK